MSEQNTKNDFNYCLRQLSIRALELCYDDYYDFAHVDYDILIIENLMCNGRCHLVAVFKNYLIEDDKSEYLRRFYKKKESKPRLKKLFAYHDETSVIFPNYVPLVESKYLYNNVIKKQRVIDEQQSLDKIRKEKKTKKNQQPIKKEERMFNSTVVGEILASNKSVIRIMFGLDEYALNNIEKKSNDDSDCQEFDKLINEVEKAEEKADNFKDNSLEGFNLTNKASKYKLKLGNKLNSNNVQIKNKPKEKQYNITNNSTNITSISNINNNISNNTKLKNYQKNNNLSLKDTSLQTHTNLKINKKQKNLSLNKTSPNKKYIEDINNYKSRNYHVNINSKTLYGDNFHSNNKIIQSLINKEKKINLKSKSNNSHHQYADKIKSNIFSNNYIYNRNFPQNLKINERNINFYGNRNSKLNLIVKSYNDKGNTPQIPKIDLNKVKMINTNDNKYNSNTNRNNNRNNNYILNNPNLFFIETDVLKSERNNKQKNLKKGNIKTKIGPILTFSPLKLNSKIIVGKDNKSKFLISNEKIVKSVNHRNTKINQYLSSNTNYINSNYTNHNKNKSKKNLIINEYNYKAVPKINQEQNYFNRFFKK
jgi:hypothetical protein